MFHQTTLDLIDASEQFMALIAQNGATTADREIACFYCQILHELVLASSSEHRRPSVDQRRRDEPPQINAPN
jgi:hypothetical protein